MRPDFDDAGILQGQDHEGVPARRVKEALSWRLVAEFLRRFPAQLRVIEAHNGGEQYDELEIVQRDGRDPGFIVSLNRVGSAHFRGPISGCPDFSKQWTSIWLDALVVADPKVVVDELVRRAGLSSSRHLPASTPGVITVRTIAQLLAPGAFERRRFECRNGYYYGSNGGGVRWDWFNKFPSSIHHARRQETDFRGEPAFRFWFLLRDDEPRLALEDTGWAWTLNGEEIDLVDLYRRARTLQAVTARLGPELFG